MWYDHWNCDYTIYKKHSHGLHVFWYFEWNGGAAMYALLFLYNVPTTHKSGVCAYINII